MNASLQNMHNSLVQQHGPFVGRLKFQELQNKFAAESKHPRLKLVALAVAMVLGTA
jgi:hypothetical protein